jgi:hypothetical protein
MEAGVASEPGLTELRRLIAGFSVSIGIAAVADLGIADHLSDGPKTATDLARLSGADEYFLRRILRYLASEGVFEELDGDGFALTERSRWLRSDVPGSLRPRAVSTGSARSWTAWGHLLESLRSGTSAFQVAFGEGLFDYAKSHPDAAAPSTPSWPSRRRPRSPRLWTPIALLAFGKWSMLAGGAAPSSLPTCGRAGAARHLVRSARGGRRGASVARPRRSGGAVPSDRR